MFRTFPQDEPYRQKLLADAGLDPEESPRLRSIAGPAEIRAILKGFRNHPEVYKPGERPESRRRESDSHGLENVAACRFRANFHIHTQYSDGRLSVPKLLQQAAAYADRVAENLSSNSLVPFAPFTVGIMDHNRVEGCAEAIRLIHAEPERFRNLRVILGSEITVRIRRIYQFELREKRHVHFLMVGITPQDPCLEAFLLPFADAVPPTHRDFHGAPSVTLSQISQLLHSQRFGALAMAHPSRIQLKRFLVEPQYATEAMRQYIHLFHKMLGRRALYVEAYYQAYTGNLALDSEELRTILETTAAERLFAAGGMDTHGANIFFSNTSPRFSI